MRDRAMMNAVCAGVALAVAMSATELQAQLAPPPDVGQERASFALNFGMFSPMSSFEHAADDPLPGSESSLESGLAIGATATAWPFERLGFRVNVSRATTEGTNDTFEFAPLAVQEATQWTLLGEVIARQPFLGDAFSGFPYVSIGAGGKQYTWSHALHDEERYFALTGAGGIEIRPSAFGRFGINAEVRAYRSEFNSFGLNGGNWRVGTPAHESEPVGFYGGVTDDLTNWDVLFTTGISMSF